MFLSVNSARHPATARKINDRTCRTSNTYTTMGIPLLPDELMLMLTEQWPCRETQITRLASLLSVSNIHLVRERAAD